MERIKSRRQPRLVFLSPAARGWHLRVGEDETAARTFATLEEAAVAIPAEHAVHLALPAGAVLVERMRLPATNREELMDMMRLQLEKTLPFPAEEVTSEMEIIEQTESESVILALAVHIEQLDTVCAPLLKRRVLPEKITFFAMHLAASCGAGTQAVLYAEDGKTVFAICESGKMGYVQTYSSSSSEDFFSELPQWLLSAELDGVPVNFASVLLDKDLSAWEEKAREFFGLPVETFSPATPRPEPAVDFVPAQWQRDRDRLSRASRVRDRLVLAGVLYLLLLLCAAGAIFFMQRRLTALDQQVRATQPQVDTVAAEKTRWQALAPAIEPSRYTVELLLQVFNSLSSDEIRLTSFTQTPTQFAVDAEAPTANAAVEFSDRLKNNPELKDFAFEITPPTILPNEHAQLRVFGKL